MNRDGKLELQEFLTGCLGDEEMVNILKTRDKKETKKKVYYFTEENPEKKIKFPLESSISIFDEIKLLE